MDKTLFNTYTESKLYHPPADEFHPLAILALESLELMFNNLTKKLTGIFDSLRNRGALTEQDIEKGLREIRIALLEADVALSVAKSFIERVKEKALGQEVIESVTPGQMIVKIVHDQLIELLSSDDVEGDNNSSHVLNLKASPPVVIMMIGLQGSGKTTSTAKIAKRLKRDTNKKILMASLDVYRPAAREQLEVLGKQISIDTLPIIDGESPLDIAKRAEEKARLEGYDILFLDTAGRLHIDDELMNELKEIKEFSNPSEIMFVADAMTGQESVNIADTFHKAIGITGITLTRIDGDARGGAALSMKKVTNCPIKYMGVGEGVDEIEEFDPKRIADRILDMGDIVGLVEKAAEAVNEKEAAKMAQKMQQGKFDLDDLRAQLLQMEKMGGFSSILSTLPGASKIQEKLSSLGPESGIDDNMIKQQIAIINSMTKKERRDPKILNASRKRRIAFGAGVEVPAVNRVLKQFKDMQRMMKRMNKLGKKGLSRGGLMSLFR